MKDLSGNIVTLPELKEKEYYLVIKVSFGMMDHIEDVSPLVTSGQDILERFRDMYPDDTLEEMDAKRIEDDIEMWSIYTLDMTP